MPLVRFRTDQRIWIDYAQRIPQPDELVKHEREVGFDLVERARSRARAAIVEKKKAIAESFADAGPIRSR